MKKMLKCLKWLGIGIVALAALLTAYFYIGGIEWGDWTIPDEKELRLEKRDVPDEDNVYIALMALTNLYHVADNDQATETPDGDSSKEITDKVFVNYYADPFNREGWEKWAAVRSDPASPKRAERILADNAKFFDAFRMALSRKDFKVAENRETGGDPCLAQLPPLMPVVDFSRLVSLKVQMELEKGDVKTAIKDVRDIHSLGQILAAKTDARSSGLVQFLVGGLLKRFAYVKICDTIVMGKTTDEMLDMFVKMADDDDAVAPANRARVLKAEWDLQFRSVDWFCDTVYNSAATPLGLQRARIIAAAMAANDVSEARREKELQRYYNQGSLLWSWPGLKRFALHRCEMKFYVAETLRATLAKKDLDGTLDKILPPNPIRKFVTLLLPNACGKVLVVSSTPDFESYFIVQNLSCQRTRLILAAEKWRRAHGGKNPPTLDALVPDYLAAVPKDPWDKFGGPIKYDAASGVAWSVGKEGEYDYRKVLKRRASKGNNSKDDDDAQAYASSLYAFRLDGKPIGFATSHHRQ